MQIKRFEAQSMTEALKMIKREFGPEAVILSAKSLKQEKGIFGFVSRPNVEVTAATDRLPIVAPGANKIAEEYSSRQGKTDKIHEKAQEKKEASLERIWTKSSASKYEICEVDIEESVSKKHAKELFQIHEQMILEGVEEKIASDLIGEIKRIALSREFMGSRGIRECLINVLERMGVSIEPIRVEAGKQRIAAFVGPTGVGKTTTIAKIASIHAVHMGRQVALITLDDYRIAAVEQLKVYAKIIGIPAITASNKHEFKRALRRLAVYDLILIDTAGISKNDTAKINELEDCLDGIPNLETHLLLNPATKEKDLVNAIERFQTIPINKLLFTKLDETSSYGVILNQMIRTKLPVSYFTDGQQVPEDMVIPDVNSLVNLISGDQKEQELWPAGQQAAENMESEREPQQPLVDAPFVANRNTDVFHALDCQWAKKINTENVIVFESIEEGLKKGYNPCRLCNPAGGENYESQYIDTESSYSAIY